MHDKLEYVTQAMQAGARGYVLKDAPGKEIVLAIETVMAGGIYYSAALARQLARPALLTKFMHGAGYAIAAMVVLFFLMLGIHKHYERVRAELRVSDDDLDAQMLPSRVHAIVLVSKIHKPTLRALAYARATRPSKLEAITVNVEPEETKALQDEWDRRDIPVPLKALDSPYREITRPVVDYVKSLRSGTPATSSSSTSRSTSSESGTSRCCTTRARCASRAACSSPRASWSRACRGSSRPPAGQEERFDGPTAGSVRFGQ